MTPEELKKAEDDKKESDAESEEDEVEKVYKASEIEPLLEKMAKVIEVQQTQIDTMMKEGGPGGSPTDDVERESDVDHDPTDDDEDNEPSPDADTKPAHDTTDGARVTKSRDNGADIEGLINKAVEERLSKVQTPLPFGYPDTSEVRDFMKGDIKTLICKAITVDRLNCGYGDITRPKGGAGDDRARGATLQWVKKNLDTGWQEPGYLYKTYEGGGDNLW